MLPPARQDKAGNGPRSLQGPQRWLRNDGVRSLFRLFGRGGKSRERLCCLCYHGLEHREVARADKPASNVALRVHKHGGRKLASVITATDLISLVEHDRVIDTARTRCAGHLLTDPFQRGSRSLVVVMIAVTVLLFFTRRMTANVAVLIGNAVERHTDDNKVAANPACFTT